MPFLAPLTALWRILTAKPPLTAIGALIALCGFLCLRLAMIDGDRDKWRTRTAAVQLAFDETVAGYRAAAIEAERIQQANLERVKSEQEAISNEVLSSYERRLADARRLLAAAKTNPRRPAETGMPSVPAATGGVDEATGDVLSDTERLIAAEQAIQLDELINWVARQAMVAPD